jgi:3-hydroxy acid dehydrogenase/malonic semialdehyde reductase
MTHPTKQELQDRLAGHVAIITGASQGIGQAIAFQLAALGIHMVLCARSTDKLQHLAEQLRQKHPTIAALAIPCDVRDAQQVQHVVDETLKKFNRVDILINNAGVAPKACLLQELSVEDIDRTIDTNLKGALYFIRTVLPPMVHQQGGTIININSIAGKTAYPFWSVYDASKFGLHAITEAVAEEQRSNHIKVVGIYPGAVDTAIWEGIALEKAPRREGMLDPEDVAEAVVYVLKQPGKVLITDITLTPLKPIV